MSLTLTETIASPVRIEAEEEDFASYIEIDKLVEFGVNATDVKKLKEGGIMTVDGVIMRTKKQLCAIKGLSEAKVDKVLEAAAKCGLGTFKTGREILEKRKDIIRLTTGSKQLDDLLGGGIETRSITEAFGEFRTGKTQLCHTLAVTSQLPRESGGGEGAVLYIDTEGTFRPERIVPICERFGVNSDEVLDNITYARAYTHEHQQSLLTQVAALMMETPYRLLIVDSLTALYRVDFSGRGELAERQQRLAGFCANLTKIAEEFGVAVFVTNQVISDPGAGAMFVQDPKKPAGGHVVAHASTTRLYLRKGRGEQRICRIYDSPSMPESETIYQISNNGITDPSE